MNTSCAFIILEEKKSTIHLGKKKVLRVTIIFKNASFQNTRHFKQSRHQQN